MQIKNKLMIMNKEMTIAYGKRHLNNKILKSKKMAMNKGKGKNTRKNKMILMSEESLKKIEKKK